MLQNGIKKESRMSSPTKIILNTSKKFTCNGEISGISENQQLITIKREDGKKDSILPACHVKTDYILGTKGKLYFNAFIQKAYYTFEN